MKLVSPTIETIQRDLLLKELNSPMFDAEKNFFKKVIQSY